MRASLSCFFTAFAMLFLGVLPVHAQIPRTISYQGIITDNQGKALQDGNITLGVILKDPSSGDITVYSDPNTNAKVVNGVFNADLGPFPPSVMFDRQYNLYITYNQTTFGPTKLQSTPYSLNAAHADVADSLKGFNRTAASGVPIGTIVAYFGDVDASHALPDGWLLCNGASFNISTYPALNQHLIGMGYPNPASTPDLRGMFLRGANVGRTDQFADPDPRLVSPAGSTGQKIGSVQADAVEEHSHPFTDQRTDFSSSGQPGTGKWHVVEATGAGNIWVDESEPVSRTPPTFGGSETRPNNVYVNWIIKAR